MGCSYYTCDSCGDAVTEYDGGNQEEICSKRCCNWICWICLKTEEQDEELDDVDKVPCICCEKNEAKRNIKIENKTKLLALMRDMKISKRNRDDIIEYITNNKMA